MKPHRLYAAGPLAMATTFGLFFTMNALVAGDGEVTIDDMSPRIWVDFVQVPDDPPAVREMERVEPPVDVMDPPETIEVPLVIPNDPHDTGPYIGGPKVVVDPILDPMSYGALSDGDHIPVVRVQPSYPHRAQERGIEGFAVVEFTIEADGSVPANSVFIVESEPKGYFETEAVKAARKFKYKPKVVNGVGQAVSGVKYRFSFAMPE